MQPEFTVAEMGTLREQNHLSDMALSGLGPAVPSGGNPLYSSSASAPQRRSRPVRNPSQPSANPRTRARTKARPRRKTTSTISMAQAVNVSEANNHARHIGMELNVFATIHWALAPSPRSEADRLQNMLDCYKSWMGRQSLKPTYVYVRERGKAKGDHVHLLIHIPNRARAKFTRLLKGWVCGDSGNLDPRAIDVRPIRKGTTFPLKKYLLKGGDKEVRQSYRAPWRGSQGRIVGKRVGVSRNIDRAARRSATGLS